jgi:hypothetical protein
MVSYRPSDANDCAMHCAGFRGCLILCYIINIAGRCGTLCITKRPPYSTLSCMAIWHTARAPGAKRSCVNHGRFVVATTTSKAVLLWTLLGPVTIAGSLGTPVQTIAVKRYTTESNRGFAFSLFYSCVPSPPHQRAVLQGPLSAPDPGPGGPSAQSAHLEGRLSHSSMASFSSRTASRLPAREPEERRMWGADLARVQ